MSDYAERERRQRDLDAITMTPEQETRAVQVRDELAKELKELSAYMWPTATINADAPGWNTLLTAVARCIVRETSR